MSQSFNFDRNQTAGLLFIMAKHAAKRAKKSSGTLGEEMEVMTAVVLCVIVAEAAINEIGDWFEFHHLRPPLSIPHGLPHDFEKMTIRGKWSILPMVVRHKSFDQGKEPWQSFEALVELRNAMVHFHSGAMPTRVKEVFRQRGLTDAMLRFPVAEWACENIASMFEALTDLIEPPKEWLDSLWLWTPRYFPHGLSTPGDLQP